MVNDISSQPKIAEIEHRLLIAQVTILVASILLVVALVFFERTLGTFFFSFLVGALAASLALRGRLAGLKPETLRQLSATWGTTLTPLMHGGVMALVAYLLFMAGILTYENADGLFRSNLFPNFTKPEMADGELLTMRKVLSIRPAAVMDGGKLLVWCFIAGYSEKFVPNLLSTLQRKDSGEERKAD